MKEISLRKRILYYVGLSVINLIVALLAIMLAITCVGVHEGEIIFASLALAFLISHYVFGLIFLKTKRIFKLIVPFVTSIVSFGCACLIAEITIDIIYSDILLAFVLLFPIIFVWEIAYQILKRCLNKKSSSQNQMSEL